MRIVELALNLIWAVIAVASYAFLFRYLSVRATARSRGPSQLQCIIALTCVLAILFPVISLTDDLHEMQATAEEASTSGLVIKRCVASHSSTPARTLHHVPLIFAPVMTNVRWAVIGTATAEDLPRPLSVLPLGALGRAPPLPAIAQSC
jgi:hypothetical protein